MTKKHETTIKEWIKYLDRKFLRLEDSLKRVGRFKDIDDIVNDLDRLIEDAEALLNDAKFARECLKRINELESNKDFKIDSKYEDAVKSGFDTREIELEIKGTFDEDKEDKLDDFLKSLIPDRTDFLVGECGNTDDSAIVDITIFDYSSLIFKQDADDVAKTVSKLLETEVKVSNDMYDDWMEMR